jgi:hypothetical protein
MLTRPLIYVFIISLLLLAWVEVLPAQFHGARLRTLSRTAARVGETFELSVTGDHLDEVDELMFSNPAILAVVNTTEPQPFRTDRSPAYGSFTVQVPNDLPPGRYEVRAIGRHGLTNPRAFLVTELPIQLPPQQSHPQTDPTVIAPGDLIPAVAAAKTTDWFAIDVQAGATLQIELLARRLDSVLIGQIEMFDSRGKRIGAARGSDNLDPLLTTGPLPAGRYTLAVRDFLFRGGSEFHYLLFASDSASTDDRLVWSNHTAGQLPIHWFPNATSLGDVGSLQADVLEPSDGPTAVQPPIETTRWLPAGHADDLFELPAAPQQPLAIDVISQRAGEPTDVRMMIHLSEPQSSGEPVFQQILHVDDSPGPSDGVVDLATKDPIALFTPPVAGSYQLSIRDLDIGTTLRARQQYRLRVRIPNPGFDLVAYQVFPSNDPNAAQPLATKLFRGGAEMIRVFAIRRDGWAGPIHVSVENLLPGVSCGDAVIAADQTSTAVAITAAETATGRVDSIRVVGRSEDETSPIQVVAVPVAISRGREHGRGGIESRITTALPVAIAESDLAPLTFTLGDGSIAEAKPGATLSLPIGMVRRLGGDGPAVFRPRDLPAGITAGEVTIAADASAGAIELKLSADTKPGLYSIWLQAETKIKIRPNPQQAERAAASHAE